MEVLSSAQFHGARRIADKKDRFWWAAILLLVLLSALVALVSAIWRYQSNPTYLARTGSKQTSPSFPCIMICPEVYYPQHKVDALLKDLTIPEGMNETWLKENMYTLAALYSPDVTYSKKDLEILEDVLEYNNLTVEDVPYRLTSTCEEILLRCRWRQRIVKCNSIFEFEMTTYGFCCVFNGRSLQRELNKTGAEKKRDTKFGDSRVGFTNGLMVAIDQSQEMDDVDLTYKWVTIQLSQQYVECSYNGTPIAPATEQWVGFGGETVQTVEEARQLSYSLRKCRFSYEALEYFPEYNKAYCNMECAMHRSIKNCNCVPLSYPRPDGIPYCRARNLSCGRAAAVAYDSDKCDCPLPCDQESDYIVIQSYEFRNDTPPIDSFYNDLNLQKISIIRVYIPTHNLNTFSRRPVYDSIALFSQMGGVFSVFFGCSILTLLELAQLLFRGLFRSKARTNAIAPVLNGKKKKVAADRKKEHKSKRNRKQRKM